MTKCRYRFFGGHQSTLNKLMSPKESTCYSCFSTDIRLVIKHNLYSLYSLYIKTLIHRALKFGLSCATNHTRTCESGLFSSISSTFTHVSQLFTELQCNDFFPPRQSACGSHESESSIEQVVMDAANNSVIDVMANRTRSENDSCANICDPAAAMHCVIEVQSLALQTTPDWMRICP